MLEVVVKYGTLATVAVSANVDLIIVKKAGSRVKYRFGTSGAYPYVLPEGACTTSVATNTNTTMQFSKSYDPSRPGLHTNEIGATGQYDIPVILTISERS